MRRRRPSPARPLRGPRRADSEAAPGDAIFAVSNRAFILMARAPQPVRTTSAPVRLRDLLSLDRSLAGPVTQLMYLAGLGLILLVGFGVVGAFVGAALREGSMEGFLIAVPGFVAGLLGVAVAALLWRWMCEFYVAVFRIADDLSALRASAAGREALGAQDAAQNAPAQSAPAQRVSR